MLGSYNSLKVSWCIDVRIDGDGSGQLQDRQVEPGQVSEHCPEFLYPTHEWDQGLGALALILGTQISFCTPSSYITPEQNQN